MTASFVRVKSGAYRSTDVSGQVFQLVEQFKQTAKGSYVTVKNGGKFPGFPEQIRIKVNGVFCPAGIQILPDGLSEAEIAVVILEMEVVMVVGAAGKQVPVVITQV